MITPTLKGQAPISVTGRAVEATITEGSNVFTSTAKGSFLLLMAEGKDPLKNPYVIIPTSSNMVYSQGSGSYGKNLWEGNNTAWVSLSEKGKDGNMRSLFSSFVFTSTTAGRFETGFGVSSYFGVSPYFPKQKGSFSLYDGKAPDSLKGTSIELEVAGETYPFSMDDKLKVRFHPVNDTYELHDIQRLVDSGTYVYSKGESGASSIELRTQRANSWSYAFSWKNFSEGAFFASDLEGSFKAGRFQVIPPPVIIAQPTSVIVGKGGMSQFNVVVRSVEPATYQWRKDGVDISGGTGNTFILRNVEEIAAGSYDVIVTSPSGSVTSGSATLKVIFPVTIVGQPAPVLAALGEQALLRVTVNGTPPFSFSWTKDGVVLPSAKSGTLLLSNLTPADFGSYKVEIANDAGKIESDRAVVYWKAGIASHPTNVSTRLEAAATFSVIANGAAPLSYQWRKNGSPIAGAILSTYTVPRVNPDDTGTYDVQVQNAFGSVISNRAELAVSGEKGISFVHPIGQMGAGNAAIVVGARGNIPTAIDPVQPGVASTTYGLLRLFRGMFIRMQNATLPVPEDGMLEIPASRFVNSGTYAVEYVRRYTNGLPADRVISAPFMVDTRSMAAAAGVYELLLEDSNFAIKDGASYRGSLILNVSKTGVVSGKLRYILAPELSGSNEPACRLYEPVVKSFSGVFNTSKDDLEKLVCTPRIGGSSSAEPLKLTLELDFTSRPVSLKARVLDRISVPPGAVAEGAVSNGIAPSRNLTELSGTVGTDHPVLLRTAMGRYNMSASIQNESEAANSVDGNAFVTMQVLPSGRVLWASRLKDESGSGAAGFRCMDPMTLVAPFYEARCSTNSRLHRANSLLGTLSLDLRADAGWSTRLSVGTEDGFVERQSSYVVKNNGRAEYSDRFAFSATATKEFNWCGRRRLNFSEDYFCRWDCDTHFRSRAHFWFSQGTADGMPLGNCMLTVKSSTGETLYEWGVSVAPTGSVHVIPKNESQPTLQLSFEKVRGTFRGWFVSPDDNGWRALVGTVIRAPRENENLLRARGWIEMGDLPALKTATWSLELAPP